MQGEFYIGYEPDMPNGLARRIRITAIATLILGAAVAGMLVIAQGRFASASFEYGRVRVFDGRLVEYPYPALLGSGEVDPTSYWLVGLGKHGVSQLTADRDGRLVRVRGSLIERDGDRMIEVRSLEVIADRAAQPLAPLRSLGPVALNGEIVDGKCHLGVMKPGEGPTHRDCAVRCLLGRITPLFAPSGDRKAPGLTPQAPGLRAQAPGFRAQASGYGSQRLALINPAGRAFDASLDALVGRPVVIRGELWSRGPLRFLSATAASIQVQEKGASFLNVASTQR
jgi:hypothetical protein